MKRSCGSWKGRGRVAELDLKELAGLWASDLLTFEDQAPEYTVFTQLDVECWLRVCRAFKEGE